MMRFEYREYAVYGKNAANDLETAQKKRHRAALASLGDQGWELVSTAGTEHAVLYTFKRPIPRPKVQVPPA